MDLIQLLRSLGLEVEGDDLSLLSDDDLTAAEELLRESYADARTAMDIEAAEAAVGAIEQVRAENTRREEALGATEARFAELDAQVEPSPDEPEPDPAAEPAPDAEENPSVDAPGDAEVDPETQQPAEAETAEEPVAAGVQAAAIPRVTRVEPAAEAAHRRLQERAARRSRMPQSPAARQAPEGGRRNAIVAGADLDGLSPGQEFRDIQQVGEATAQRIHSLQQAARQNPRMGGRFLVASMQVEYPEDRTLTASAAENSELIERATRAAATATIDEITAAGGLCAPVDARYEMFGVGDDRRPIRDALVRFNGARGGVRFIAPPTLSQMATAVEIWTEANDTTPSNPATKPCLTITCGSEIEEVIDAVTKCLKVGNFSRRTFPEQFAAWWRLAGVEHAREAETQLWTRMLADTGVLDVTTGELLGASRDILENLTQSGAAYRSRRRMDPNAVLRVIMPEWTLDLIVADAVRQLPGDDKLEISRADADRMIRSKNIAPTYTPDTGQEFGAQTDGAALLRWPDTVQMLMFAEGTYLFIDGGQLDFGMEIRDSTLNATNDVQAFMETFEGEAFVGNEALHLTLNVCPDGSSSATVDINPCTTGS